MRRVRRKADDMSDLVVLDVPLSEMKPLAWNPRTISVFQMEALKSSLREFGAVEPIVLDQDNQIVGGHQRYQAAIELGWETFPAVRASLTTEQLRLLNLALNKISGEWRSDALAELIASIAETTGPESLGRVGFEPTEVNDLLASLRGVPEPSPLEEGSTAHKCPSCGHEWRGSCTPDV